MFGEEREFKLTLAGKDIFVITGKYCGQANGTCQVRSGDTVVMVNVTMSEKAKEGADFFPLCVDFEEKIVLIEEVSEEPYQIDRYLSSLYLSGGLQKAKGFILGYFTDCNPSESRKNDQSVLDVINHYIVKLNKPTVYNFPIGHSFPTCNLPVGIKVKLDADNKTVEIKEEFYNEF